jgi:hypothetical protein
MQPPDLAIASQHVNDTSMTSPNIKELFYERTNHRHFLSTPSKNRREIREDQLPSSQGADERSTVQENTG